jgi:glycosyltransferase involved in cell wall biosynthesis
MKILFITPNLPEYRVKVYGNLSKYHDITILHSGKEYLKNDAGFKQIIIPVKRFGPFSFLSVRLNKICKQFDIIVSEANIRHLDRDLLILNPFRRYKWIAWGIGVSASYEKEFDTDTSLDTVRHFIFKHADANIFYSKYPVDKYLRAGFDPASLFVANNTTFVSYSHDKVLTKNKLLFVGTLYKQKRIFELLDAYWKAYKLDHNILPLDIIGQGIEYSSINTWVRGNQLENKIRLLGAIFDQSVLEEHFRTSYACISPGQAGLSVLTSMGYGTPFITRKDAITGGEIFNIVNHDNGILYNDSQELISILLDITNNPPHYIQMGMNAREHYLQNCTIERMVDGFMSAFDYVAKRKHNPK